MGKIDRKSIKVLWVSLVKFPPLCEHLGETIPAHCGWMYSSAKALLRMMPEVRLGVMVYLTAGVMNGMKLTVLHTTLFLREG